MTQFNVSPYPADIGGNTRLTQQPCTQAFQELQEVLVIEHSRGDVLTHTADGPGYTVPHLDRWIVHQIYEELRDLRGKGGEGRRRGRKEFLKHCR